MYTIGKYTENDIMSDLICKNYPMLLVLVRFGIPLGVGEKTIRTICNEYNVDTNTFLAVVNLLIDENREDNHNDSVLSIESIINYLRNSHNYFLNFKFPSIRQQLVNVLDYSTNSMSALILHYYDEYVEEVCMHMKYEEETVFPYIETLLQHKRNEKYSIGIFSRQHDKVELKLTELKNIIIKYYPTMGNYDLNNILFDIFLCAADLTSHNDIEDYLLVPRVVKLERQINP